MQFHKPETLDGALALIAEDGGRILAGGTDFFPSLGGQTTADPVVDVTRIPELCGISFKGDHWRIGAATTWREVARTELPAMFKGLQLAAREVGSIQIQNAGTIAGNLCNASPAADGVPPLLALDASVEIAGPAGRRVLPLCDFIIGVRKIALQPGELVTAVLVPQAEGFATSFLKLGARRYLVISIAMVAAGISLDEAGAIARASVAVGACSAVAQRLPQLEATLIGLSPTLEAVSEQISDEALAVLSPLSDVRGSADYRMYAVRELIARAVVLAAGKGEE